MSYGDKPFGLNEIVVERNSVQVAFPASRRMMFKERVKSAEFNGDDKLQAVATLTEGAEFEIEAGGIPLEAYALMTGRVVSETGVTPNRSKTLTGSGAQRYPYFTLYGKSLGDEGDDTHVVLYKCKLTEGMEGSFAYGEFFATKTKGIAIDDGTNGVWDIIPNETAAALPEPEGS